MRNKIILSAIFVLGFFLFVGKPSIVSAEEANRICKGVFIDAVNVGGMTKEEAEAAIEDYIAELRNKDLAILANDNVVYAELADIDYDYIPNDNIEKALAFGKSGNLIKRYKDLKDIEYGSIVLPLSYTFDENKLRQIIIEEVGAYDIAPVNATLARKDNKFIYKDHVLGVKVDVDRTFELIKDILLNNWNRSDIIVKAIMAEVMPEYTKEDVEMVTSILGSFTTEYASSAEGRAANLANGARLINNAVVYPGEVFSSYEYLTPFTKENGYYVAGAYLQGKVIDSVGGGACQVTTTLYNAILMAELEVVERQPHSMTISYVDLSRDAAIAGTYKDFKFRNNTEYPILVEAYTKGRKITFNIWGYETRDTKNRKIVYETKILNKVDPPDDVITEDPTKPTSYHKVTQSAHTGYTAELYKIVYENGVEVSRTLVNRSKYAPAPRYVTIGTKVVEEEKPGQTDGTKKPKDEPAEETLIDESGGEIEGQIEGMHNRANPGQQLQADIDWEAILNQSAEVKQPDEE
ncbi:MAG TPA: hypothetical protein GXZ28_00775 [Clostridiales bacterium]|jgi:vancomycin resistance protein YoaR|nr:hypothetical protein [Clostridiales bacterium]